MSKELEALQEIKLGYICGQGAINEFALRENERENFKIIETALREKETPTETFEQFVGESSEVIYKKLKAFEIMTKCDLKKNDITRFKNYNDFVKTMYLGIDGVIYGECPTQEEYDLLKEVLL